MKKDFYAVNHVYLFEINQIKKVRAAFVMSSETKLECYRFCAPKDFALCVQGLFSKPKPFYRNSIHHIKGTNSEMNKRSNCSKH